MQDFESKYVGVRKNIMVSHSNLCYRTYTDLRNACSPLEALPHKYGHRQPYCMGLLEVLTASVHIPYMEAIFPYNTVMVHSPNDLVMMCLSYDWTT